MWLRIKIYLTIALVTSLLVGAVIGYSANPVEITASKPKAREKALVNTDWLDKHIDDVNVRTIDVSSSKDVYSEGHIPNSVFINMSDLVDQEYSDIVAGQVARKAQIESVLSSLGISNDMTVVLYSDRDNLFAARAFWVLDYYGHKELYILDGGSKKWVQEGRQFSTDVPKITPTQYTANYPKFEIRATWDRVLGSIENPEFLILDCRGSDEYTGVKSSCDSVNTGTLYFQQVVREPRLGWKWYVRKDGHIPGAVNVEWVFAMAEDGTFRSVEELRELYEGAGVTGDKEIITYCQRGVRSAHTWFVLKYILGYLNVSNYDGSWEEWANRLDLPMIYASLSCEDCHDEIPASPH